MACWVLLALGLTTIAIAQGSMRTDAALPAPASSAALSAAASSADRGPLSRVDAAPPATSTPSERPAPRTVGETATPERGVKPAASAQEDERRVTLDAPAPPGPTGTVQSSSTSAAVNAQVARPATVVAPDIGVDSILRPLGLNADGTLEVPAVGPRYDDAGWFTGSPRPGEVGPAVLLGHVNGAGGAPSAFYHLAELRPGQQVTVIRDDGSQAHFEVYLVEQYPKDQFPTAAVYGDTTGPELRLITCAGTWDAGTGHYRDNTVVYATLIVNP